MPRKPTPKHHLKLLRRQVGRNIYSYRHRRRLSILECATRADISGDNWRLYEEGRGQMGLHTLLRIATALGIHPQDLLIE